MSFKHIFYFFEKEIMTMWNILCCCLPEAVFTSCLDLMRTRCPFYNILICKSLELREDIFSVSHNYMISLELNSSQFQSATCTFDVALHHCKDITVCGKEASLALYTKQSRLDCGQQLSADTFGFSDVSN